MTQNKDRAMILGYGEDTLTLQLLQNWGKRKRFSEDLKLKGFNVSLNQRECKIFYRPSFGRAYVGEPDFIIFAKTKTTNPQLETEGFWFIGEAKWDKSSEVLKNGTVRLRKGQEVQRIKKFEYLLAFWRKNRNSDKHRNWEALYKGMIEVLDIKGNPDKLKDSGLVSTISDFLREADDYFPKADNIKLKPLVVVFVPHLRPDAVFAAGTGNGMTLLTCFYDNKNRFIKINYVRKPQRKSKKD